jgi:hypothetical protein
VSRVCQQLTSIRYVGTLVPLRRTRLASDLNKHPRRRSSERIHITVALGGYHAGEVDTKASISKS